MIFRLPLPRVFSTLPYLQRKPFNCSDRNLQGRSPPSTTGDGQSSLLPYRAQWRWVDIRTHGESARPDFYPAEGCGAPGQPPYRAPREQRYIDRRAHPREACRVKPAAPGGRNRTRWWRSTGRSPPTGEPRAGRPLPAVEGPPAEASPARPSGTTLPLASRGLWSRFRPPPVSGAPATYSAMAIPANPTRFAASVACSAMPRLHAPNKVPVSAANADKKARCSGGAASAPG